MNPLFVLFLLILVIFGKITNFVISAHIVIIYIWLCLFYIDYLIYINFPKVFSILFLRLYIYYLVFFFWGIFYIYIITPAMFAFSGVYSIFLFLFLLVVPLFLKFFKKYFSTSAYYFHNKTVTKNLDLNKFFIEAYLLLFIIRITFRRLNDFRKYFLKKYIYTINHKRIALNYFFFSFWSGLSGAALATMIRLELAYPGSPFFKGDSLKYLQVITAHGLIMVFFVVVPILFGGFANFLIPYHVGSKDVAFPRLNSIGFWILPCGFLLVAKIASLRPQYWKYYDKTPSYLGLQTKKYLAETDILFEQNNSANYFLEFFGKKNILNNYENYVAVPIKYLFWENVAEYSDSFWYSADKVSSFRRRKIYVTKCSNRVLTTAGWTFITPFSSNTKYTGVGSQDILIISVIFAGASTTISFTNLLITRRTLVMSGLRNRRALLPFISISLLLTMRMLALVTPVLAASMFMLLLDRHWQTTFFDFTYGGDAVLFQHLFWFFGHPEVYILIIPTFGFVNMILPFANTRRIASKNHLIWAIYIMAYMGFFVWGHHMYLVGLDHRSRALYSTITIMISLPATIKVVNWTLTLLNGALKIDTAFMFTLAYLLVFTVGGFTGMWLSHVGLNISLHDTFYVVAHFHLMLSGSTIIGCFAGFYYYFTTFFGVKYSRFFSYMHLIYYTGGQWMTFLPMFWLGFSGLPRRIHDYPSIFVGWQSMATVGHLITLTGIIFFFFMLLDTAYEKRCLISVTLGLPRWYKRAHYYLYKACVNVVNFNKLSNIPNFKVREFLTQVFINEFEKLSLVIISKSNLILWKKKCKMVEGF